MFLFGVPLLFWGKKMGGMPLECLLASPYEYAPNSHSCQSGNLRRSKSVVGGVRSAVSVKCPSGNDATAQQLGRILLLCGGQWITARLGQVCTRNTHLRTSWQVWSRSVTAEQTPPLGGIGRSIAALHKASHQRDAGEADMISKEFLRVHTHCP